MAARGKSEDTRQVEMFLAEFVTPHLRAAGYRKSSHAYRLRLANGDEAGMQFRVFPLGSLGSFLFDVWVCIEPIWDLERFDPDGAHTYPKHTQTSDARSLHQQLQPPKPLVDDLAASWEWRSVGERDQLGHQMRDLLLSVVLPRIASMLDRPTLLRMAQAGEHGLLLPRYALPTVVRALIAADDESSEQLDETLLQADATEEEDSRFLAWAAARRLDGPTWRALTKPLSTQPHDLDL